MDPETYEIGIKAALIRPNKSTLNQDEEVANNADIVDFSEHIKKKL